VFASTPSKFLIVLELLGMLRLGEDSRASRSDLQSFAVIRVRRLPCCPSWSACS
jgi:hypothetical protein